MQRHILLIEDEPVAAHQEERQIRSDGFLVTRAPDFETGLALSKTTRFDAAVVDLGLPDVKDFDTVARLHELALPTVAITGSGNDDLIAAVRKLGFSYVGKPGGNLLNVEIWAQINYRNADPDSLSGQRKAQAKVMKEEGHSLSEKTPVTIDLARVIAIVITLLSSAVGVTWFVSSKINAGVQRIDLVDRNITAIRAEFLAYVATSSHRQDTLDAVVREEQAAKDKRLLEWSKWRWTISRDVIQIGETTKTPIYTKNPE